MEFYFTQKHLLII